MNRPNSGTDGPFPPLAKIPLAGDFENQKVICAGSSLLLPGGVCPCVERAFDAASVRARRTQRSACVSADLRALRFLLASGDHGGATWLPAREGDGIMHGTQEGLNSGMFRLFPTFPREHLACLCPQ